ncbi:RNA polymerase II transcription factor B subunit 1 [Exophiala xenobiotica]|uniref:RNA polymerase II transcription factor B subunit 1 n=1 Tax=Vermiconidia calcicola TaxID=1690605 RepID=A0AAV9Q1P9_9PEZI|nr:RNA polymerase II transcription factor B subunit 1 [Exophiala xenobiotica]KAK5531368.1 RNA polymerase II transcription factor B subunit 1 [Vermiconidia calcicola]KAK5540567.1 RNA polymerase II transcription factor B subunit 1 [Chaetothyriales sp. CCFEE 6169]KAK5191499.1 RNA polymerase II transcription factor B subunit 1 [Exophiala xenobiotica]KAK5218322.1 RNA polymerase II transcription factor B subunit 1 [Exophiala xenobiotica]
MAPPQGQASYKKQAGILAISNDRKSVSWTPAQPPDAAPSLVISAANVVNLQQTPESSPKVMLKIFVQDPGQSEPTAHVFTFTSKADPRSEANAIKDALANVIQAQKAAQNAADAAAASNGGQSAAMTIANVISSAGRGSSLWEDDDRLKSDVRLQQSLMQEDAALQRTFMEALSLKPESISTTQFTAQFWSSRVHLLRAHAIAQNQGRGKYNVFSELRREDGGTKLSLTQDHVRAIFEQYPVMRWIYDEVVPRKCSNEVEFWSRFFQSQLYMRLRGLKFDPTKESRDKYLDTEEFLNHPELTGLRTTAAEMHIPKFIDLEGNEENHSQRKGNRPDSELRATALDKAPIIRRLNALSEKLMATVRPNDFDASAPIGMTEATYEQLRLRDLGGDPEQERIILNIRDQSRFFSDKGKGHDEAVNGVDNTNPFKTIDVSQSIRDICDDLTIHFARPGAGVIPIDPYEDEDEDEDQDDNMGMDGTNNDRGPTRAETGSSLATKHILSLVQAHRDQTSEIPTASGLSTGIYDRLTLTQATTIEFLRQFWHAFLSGDAGRANEISSLVESLNRALDRINVIADDAEKERLEHIRTQERSLEERFRKTGRRHRLDPKAIRGGGAIVKQLLGPIIRSLANAVQRYRQAFEEQMKGLGDD